MKKFSLIFGSYFVVFILINTLLFILVAPLLIVTGLTTLHLVKVLGMLIFFALSASFGLTVEEFRRMGK